MAMRRHVLPAVLLTLSLALAGTASRAGIIIGHPTSSGITDLELKTCGGSVFSVPADHGHLVTAEIPAGTYCAIDVVLDIDGTTKLDPILTPMGGEVFAMADEVAIVCVTLEDDRVACELLR